MSLVTTASDISPRSVRHSAATRAVLPPPTGPPMPIRTARPGAAGSGVWAWAVMRSSRCKEGRLRCAVQFGQDVGQRAALGREQRRVARGDGRRRERGGVGGHGVGRPGDADGDGGDPQRVEPEQPHRGGGGAAGGGGQRARRGPAGGRPGRRGGGGPGGRGGAPRGGAGGGG